MEDKSTKKQSIIIQEQLDTAMKKSMNNFVKKNKLKYNKEYYANIKK